MQQRLAFSRIEFAFATYLALFAVRSGLLEIVTGIA